MYFIFKLIFKDVIIPTGISLSAQKMFFFFQTDSIPPTSYLLRHLVSAEHYCTEKAWLFHWLCDFDNCTYCNFSSLLSVFQSSNIILFFLCFCFCFFTWNSLGFALKPGMTNWTRLGCIRKERTRLFSTEQSENRYTWAVLLCNIALRTNAWCYIAWLSEHERIIHIFMVSLYEIIFHS